MKILTGRPMAPLKFLLLAAAMLGFTSSAAPQSGANDVLRATLSNGLRVIIVHSGLAPVVATSVNYLAGSDEAPAGFPGTAHAQEHMMFRGSPGLSADQLADIGSAMGGNFNADTRESLTQYVFTVPAEDVDVALNIEAVRMKGVSDTQKDWDQERGAIEQEVAADISSPNYLLYQKLRTNMYAGSTYAHDALGTRPSFDKTSAKMLKDFHDAWYAPNNAILVIVGDVDPQKTMNTVKSLFSAIPAKKLPAKPKLTLKPAAKSSFSLDTDSPVGAQVIAMRMPGLDSPDFPALEILSDVLSSERFDLYGLVPAGKAVDASFSLDPLPKAGIGYAAVAFAPGEDPMVIDKAVREILAKAAKDGVPADLVEAAKRQEARATEFQKNSIEGLASVWSDAVALYGLNSPDDDLVRINKVTVADVNRVAAKYLKLDEAVTAVMTPAPSDKPAAGGGFGGQEAISLGEAAGVKLPSWAEAALARVSVPPATSHPIVSKLPNGVTLIVQPEDVSNTVSVFGQIQSRPETEEPQGKEGVSALLEELMSWGSEKLDRVAFQSALDDIGAREAAGTGFSIQTLAPNFDKAIALLADNELHPGLPAEAAPIIKTQLAQLAAARDKSPGNANRKALLTSLYGASDPSLRQSTPASVNALTLDDVRAYYRSTYRPDLTTIVVIGKITPAAAKAAVEKAFGGWTAQGPKPMIDLPAAQRNAAASIAVPDASRVQDNVTLGQTLALTRKDPDYYALTLGNAVLGGGFYASRLSLSLRKAAGLVYTVNSFTQAGRTRAAYLVSYACDPQNVAKAAAMVAKEISAMQTTPVGEDELMRAKAFLVRQIPLGEGSIDAIAGGILGRMDLGLPLDEPQTAAQRYIDLTPAEVQNAFKKWMRPDDFVRVSQGPTPQ